MSVNKMFMHDLVPLNKQMRYERDLSAKSFVNGRFLNIYFDEVVVPTSKIYKKDEDTVLIDLLLCACSPKNHVTISIENFKSGIEECFRKIEDIDLICKKILSHPCNKLLFDQGDEHYFTTDLIFNENMPKDKIIFSSPSQFMGVFCAYSFSYKSDEDGEYRDVGAAVINDFAFSLLEIVG